MPEAFAEKPEQKPQLSAVPKPAAVSFEEMRKKLDSRIPDTVARKAAELGATRRIEAMNTAVSMIARNPQALGMLDNEHVAEAFVRNPSRISSSLQQISASVRDASQEERKKAFEYLKEDLAAVFARYPEVFVKTASDAKTDTAGAFLDYAGKKPEEILREALSLHPGATKELGMPLDYLHDHEAERANYLNSLKPFEVVSLLGSDPSLFFTSSNHMLFDKLLADNGKKSLQEIKKAFGLSEGMTRNLLLRAINYNRLDDLISPKNRENDIAVATATILGTPGSNKGIYADIFDRKDMYFIANGIQPLGKQSPKVLQIVESRMKELGSEQNATLDQKNMKNALEYIQYLLTKDSGGNVEIDKVAQKSVFDPIKYKSGGKTNVVQIFDKEDAHLEVDHWGMTKEWLKGKYGEPKEGKKGELIFENAEARVTLFMAETKEGNAKYIKDWVAKNNSGIITFRGHSYSLEANMPYDLFKNKGGKYVYIPGSCGSAGSVPEYIAANPNTELAFFSNTSTGRGAVTNTILDLVVGQKKPAEFSDMLQKGESRIAALKGDISEIRVRNEGEQLLDYVNVKSAAPTLIARR